jgi:hypothetical protein
MAEGLKDDSQTAAFSLSATSPFDSLHSLRASRER